MSRWGEPWWVRVSSVVLSFVMVWQLRFGAAALVVFSWVEFCFGS